MIDKKTFKKLLGAPLESAGFIKKGQSWYLNGEDTIVVVNLQKCDWGEWYFINIGIWLKALGEEVFPQAHRCHLSHRLEAYFPEQRELIQSGCRLDAETSKTLTELVEFIHRQVIPFLYECTHEGKLKELLLKGSLEHGFVNMVARWRISGE